MSQVIFSNFYALKKIRQWRFLAFLLTICLLITLFSKGDLDVSKNSDYIAEIEISDMIIDAGHQEKEILELVNDNHVKGVIVSINSPGGTTYDSEILYNALQRVAAKKPVVSVMKNVAASGGYIVALASEHIIAAGNTITGSIGVLMQIPNAKKLLDNIGVSVTEVKSSPIKGEPNYFSNTPPEAIDNLKEMLNDTDDWFKSLVKKHRSKISDTVFPSVTNGAVFTGRQAIKLGLIDQIGGIDEAKKYLMHKHKFENTIEIKKIELEPIEAQGLLEQWIGTYLSAISNFIANNFLKSRNNVDGLLSLWHI